MNAALLTVGDELLIGQVVNTNAAWLAEQLNSVGIDVRIATTVGDDIAGIQLELSRCFEIANLVVITGGLGPTHDDLTREALAEYFGVELVFDPGVFQRIEERFAQRGRSMPESNRTQAMVPAGFIPLPNPVGTAPGLFFNDPGQSRVIAVLPGVPHEMKYLMEHEVLPRIRATGEDHCILHRTILTAGIGESHLQELLGNLSGFFNEKLKLAYLPGGGGVRLRITGHGTSRPEVEASMSRLEDHITSRAGRYIYGTGSETLESVVGRLLVEQGKTISVAESCTGGHVLNRLTNVSGSSGYVIGGIVAYCNEVKQELLGVGLDVLEEEGAVSEVVAQQMAAGVRKRLKTNIGISTTGIAGPTGGTADKPVGLVWIGFADENETSAVRLQLGEDRLLNKEFSSTAVLDFIRRRLAGF